MKKRHWWIPLVLGIIILVLGILVLLFPQISYLIMTLYFGVAIILSGLIYVSMATDKGIKGRGWLTFTGVVEIILGLILTMMPAVSAIALPICLGFWLMFKGSSLIGIGYGPKEERDEGWGWTVFSAIILIICGIIILVQPILYGMEAVVWWTGVSMIIGGGALMNYSFKLKSSNAQK